MNTKNVLKKKQNKKNSEFSLYIQKVSRKNVKSKSVYTKSLFNKDHIRFTPEMLIYKLFGN